MSKVSELFTFNVSNTSLDWKKIVRIQQCPYTNKKCFKTRKSSPSVSIGTCMVKYGKNSRNVMICPHRLLQNNQIFLDCIHLLSYHEPGNELHILSEISIPGGNVDYFLVSTTCERKVVDFVGIELQTMDTTGSIWPDREQTLFDLGLTKAEPTNHKGFGINWKMTAKTILLQLHHKIDTFQAINKHLVLIIQDCLLDYMKREFDFSGIREGVSSGDSMHFHIYCIKEMDDAYKISLKERLSTDNKGIYNLLGMKADPNLELEELTKIIQSRISERTLLKI